MAKKKAPKKKAPVKPAENSKHATERVRLSGRIRRAHAAHSREMADIMDDMTESFNGPDCPTLIAAANASLLQFETDRDLCNQSCVSGCPSCT